MKPSAAATSPMRARIAGTILPYVSAALFAWSGSAAASAEAPEDMATLYKTTWAICHEVPATKAPPTDTLRRLPGAQILMAMEFGKMQPQASVLKFAKQPEQAAARP